MGFANNSYLINKLEVCNFRKFESISVSFERQLTVLVGDNGVGKSTLIDAASIALGTLFQKIENAKALGITPDDARGAVIKQGDMFDVQSRYPVTIGADGIVLGENVHWSRSLNTAKGRTTIADAAAVVDAGCKNLSAVAIRLSFPFLLVIGPIDCGRGLNLKTNRCPTGRVGTKVPYRHLRTMHV